MRRFLTALALAAASIAAPASAQVTRIIVVENGSGTVTTGGTSQQVFPVKADRGYLMCQNPIDASETLFVNLGGVAGTTNGSFEIAPGGSISFIGVGVPTTNVTVTAATTGHRFICKQGGPS